MANINLNDDSLNETLRTNYSVWTEEGTRNVKVYLCTTKFEAIQFLKSFKLSTGFVLDKMLKSELYTNAHSFLFNRTKDYIRGKISDRKWKMEQSIIKENEEKVRIQQERFKQIQEEKDANPYRMWSFNVKDNFHKLSKSTDFSLEIGKIVDKINSSITGINGDITSLVKLLKDVTVEFSSNTVDETGEKMITKKNNNREYIFIKYKIANKTKKRRLSGIFGFKKELKEIEGEYMILKPDNRASIDWCEQIMDRRITNISNQML